MEKKKFVNCILLPPNLEVIVQKRGGKAKIIEKKMQSNLHIFVLQFP